MRETSDSPPERKSPPLSHLTTSLTHRTTSLTSYHISLTSCHISLTHRTTSLTSCHIFLLTCHPSHRSCHLSLWIFTPCLPSLFCQLYPPPSKLFSKKRHCSVCGGRSACRTHCGGETVIYIYILMGWDLLWVPLHLDFAAISFSEILNYEKKFWIIFPQNISVIDC